MENLPHVAFELALVRRNESGGRDWEIFLTQRGENDPFWPNEWGMPGTIIQQNERIQTAYLRLVGEEVRGRGDFSLLQFVGISEFPKGGSQYKCRRGHEIALIHIIVSNGKNLPGGEFFPFGELPRNTIGHHRTMVKVVWKFLAELLRL
ncbi:MAG TPA: hypothetical protein DEF00_02225 [Candidatus Taylorbacteria bacterium]|nr:MAG: hypothetical protein UY03_C0006G0029 [Parcubacteria group bacterium GW2011_GWA2_47_64]KKU96534.1 MAG: hypothetical protein UY29_C0010G0039 [Parcubacteria group bacterium GW2011_GWC2_48_17]HBV01193.1 hypothetical protein [Candidatus Taylorbacteria bacterium]